MQKSEILKIPAGMQLLDDNRARFFNVAFDLKMVGKSERLSEKLAANLQIGSGDDDLAPKPEDYIVQEFRAISQAYLGEGGYFLDFRTSGVLEKAIPLMLPADLGGQRRVYLYFHRNHSRSIEDRIGHIVEAKWTGANQQFSNPGINIKVAIDKKLAPREVRMLLANPPYAESVSISFDGTFEKSHPDLDGWTFYEMLGREVDDELVRIIVTSIDEFDHVGLVYEGGDAEADKVNNSKTFIPKPQLKKDEGNKMDGLKLAAAEVLELQNMLTNVAEGISDFASLSGAIETLLEINEQQSKKLKGLPELEKKAKAFDAMLAGRRKNVSELIAKVEEEPEGFITIANQLDMEALEKLEKSYNAKLEKMFPMVCQECQSENLARRSSQEALVGTPDKLAAKTNGSIPAAQFKS